jgi:hypothetical protein
MFRPGLLTIVYLVIGVLVALARDYFADFDGIRDVVSAALAIVLWPLVLVGVNLHLGRRGGDGGNALAAQLGYVWTVLSYRMSARSR